MSLPLKVGASSVIDPSATPVKAPAPNGDAPPKSTAAPGSALKPEEISSPHELTAFVESLITQLESRFDDMSSQILERMNQMSSRVDALEGSIQDLINVDIAQPGTPASAQAPSPSYNTHRGSES